jgi:catechol 2,3-dioxygenase-like lactoylglutathione lyase family enzyme
MAYIESVTLEVADPAAADRFYTAVGLGTQVRLRALEAPTTGFRGFTLSQPATVSGLFATGSSPVKLALYERRALAKDAGVPPEGTGSHRLVIGSDAGPLTDPDGFAWEAAGTAAEAGPAMALAKEGMIVNRELIDQR